MLKRSLVVAVFLSSSAAFAQTAFRDADYFTDAQDRARLQTAEGPLTIDIDNMSLEEAIDYIQDSEPIEISDVTGLTQGFKAKGANCSGFIKSDGTFGPLGKTISKAFTDYSRLQNLISDDAAVRRGIPTLCPNFRHLTKEDRVRFWVWAFAAIAWDESTCVQGRSAKGVTTTAVGLLQMEKGYKKRYWRGQLCRFKDVGPARENILCGMEIMSGQFAGKYQGKGCRGDVARGIVTPCNYWQKLRRTSSVTRLISLFPQCGRPGNDT